MKKLLLALLLTVVATPIHAQNSGCPPAAPTLNVPSSVRAGEKYSVSWTSVLSARTSAGDYYQLQRSLDPSFATLRDKFPTARPALELPGLPGSIGVVYHRVLVMSTCATPASGLISSPARAVSVYTECPIPEPVAQPIVSPENPPEMSTYVVSWDTGAGSVPGPGGAPSGLLFRLRRTTPNGEVKESLSDRGSASFTDPRGDYDYQARAETRCGSVGAWSLPRRVKVGGEPIAALALISEPAAIALVSGDGGAPRTTFTVRNSGTTTLEVVVTSPSDLVATDPPAFRIAPGAQQRVGVSLRSAQTLQAPLHTLVSLSAEGVLLHVPIDAMIASGPAERNVTWTSDEAELGELDSVRRTLLNNGGSKASFVGRVSHPWLIVESLDGEPWDRPLAPHEARVVRIRADRRDRRSLWGTEVGGITLTTVGRPQQESELTVYDDGPTPVMATVVRPSTSLARTRLLYASMPNAMDAHGNGRFTSDLWLSNLDSASPIEVSLFFTPVGASGALVQSGQVDILLGKGETRRYRNVVSKLANYEGACEVEVRSPATTLSATAIVANTPLIAAGRRGALADPKASTSGGQYGFEMRPTLPGEGVKASDGIFVLSDLAHQTGRRTNVLLTETSGFDTAVVLKLLIGQNTPVEKDGQPVLLRVTVPALGTLQLNDSDLFDAEPIANPAFALITHESGQGSVVPFATVIDAGTEDASLRVGVSVKNLTPLPPTGILTTSRRPVPDGAALPFDGGPVPLSFPAAHLPGAALGDGSRPFWKTRVTLTNVNETQQRNFTAKFYDQSGRFPDPKFALVTLGAQSVVTYDDFLLTLLQASEVPNPRDAAVYGAVRIEPLKNSDGSLDNSWQDIDVQTETYTRDPRYDLGDYKTGMEGYSYLHGYSSFQSNLGTVQIEGAENSASFRTNLILSEVGGASCTVAVAAYWPGSFVPLATATIQLPRFGYVSRELFGDLLGLDRRDMTDIRVVVRQVDGDGVYLAFASKINLITGDPANIFLRPATAGTGR